MSKYLLPLVGIVLSFSGCVSFDSAVTAGKLAQNISQHQSVYNQSVTVCDYLQLMDTKSFPKDYCQNYSSHLKKVNEGLSTLSAYGMALEKIAEKSDFDASDKLDLVIQGGETLKWFKLDDNSEEGIKKISGTVGKLVTNSIKRKQLDKVITELDRPVQQVIDSILIPELNYRKKLYENLELHLKNITENESELKPDMRMVYSQASNKKDTLFAHYNDLDMLVAKKFGTFIENDLAEIDGCEKALEAFSLAHHQLAVDASKIGTQKDSEVAKDILESIKEIYEGIDKF